MKRIKVFATYALLLILFFVFSRILIFIGLNNTYKNIDLNESCPDGITITSAKATAVNGEIVGTVSENIESKYVKFNFYSDIDTLMGSYYITPSELENNNFEFYFKLNRIHSYNIEFTDEKPEMVNEDSFSLEQIDGLTLWVALFTLMMI